MEAFSGVFVELSQMLDPTQTRHNHRPSFGLGDPLQVKPVRAVDDTTINPLTAVSSLAGPSCRQNAWPACPTGHNHTTTPRRKCMPAGRQCSSLNSRVHRRAASKTADRHLTHPSRIPPSSDDITSHLRPHRRSSVTWINLRMLENTL
jgi:hypothetical protein